MDDPVIEAVREIARVFKIKKVILFGSRARGDNTPTSDYDIGIISDRLSPLDKARIYDRIEDIETLKKIDLAFLEEDESDSFYKTIVKEGAVFKEAFSQGLIQTETKWLMMLKDRNMTSHVYREEMADEIALRIITVYLDNFQELFKNLKAQYDNT